MRIGLSVACCGLASVLAGTAALAQEETVRTSVEMRVGQTRQLGVYGGHRPDCVTSVPPQAIEITQPPRLGTLTQRQGVPYTSAHSISGTCLGSQFTGTSVDYTARAPGTETVVLDVRFQNGASHREYRIKVTP